MNHVLNRWFNFSARSLLTLPRAVKRSVVVMVDVCLCILATWLAFSLRLGEFVKLNGELTQPVFLSVILALPIFMLSGLYRPIFRYSGWAAVLAVGRAVSLYGLIYITIVMAIGIDKTPRTVGILQPLLLFFSVAGSRILARYWLGSFYQDGAVKRLIPRALVYGAGAAGRQLAIALNAGNEMRIAGFLDDDYRLHGHVLNGLPIFSPYDLDGLMESKGITHVLMAIPSATRQRRNEILEKFSGRQVAIRTLPSVEDLAAGRITTSDLRELDIDDLLGREAVAPDFTLLMKNIGERVVLVTGAGGSIGGELCRQIIKLRPEKLLLVDSSEFALYTIHSELEVLREASVDRDAIRIVPLLASVQDEDRMREIMDAWLPQTVYHAAAYKHVPIVEHNLAEGLKNNVIGTLVTAQVAIEKGVSDFVLISTDKAVRPTNVMGASKRLAELCLQALWAQQLEQAIKKCSEESQGAESTHVIITKFSMVRFGNVLDSSGSVIPKFRKQIRDGGPITLTHPDITRYFMTIQEAAQLVIQAGAMAKGGDVFVLDMGESVKIANLARRMVELSGLSVCDAANPDGDIEIMISGLRPGEKLYEELLLGDDPQPTQHPSIQRAQDAFIPWHELKVELETLKTLRGQNHVEVILKALQKLVAGYQPNGEVVDWVFSEQMRKSDGANKFKTLPSGSSLD